MNDDIGGFSGNSNGFEAIVVAPDDFDIWVGGGESIRNFAEKNG